MLIVKDQTRNKLSTVILAALVAMALLMIAPSFAEQITSNYLYTLSDFTGPVPYSWVKMFLDKKSGEIYVANSAERTIRVFNNSGMEVYSFGDDADFGGIIDLAVDESGQILILSYNGRGLSIIKCNFRGEPRGKTPLPQYPAEVGKDFFPNSMVYRSESLYLVDKNSMKVVKTDLQGRFQDFFDLGQILKLDEKKRMDSGIVGFTVDADGNLFFTVPVLFQAYKVSPDKTVQGFGVRGSTPGRFNIIGGIDVDSNGYIYITDTLRCVVMIFDKEFNFKMEFGYRGDDLGNLIAPMEVVADRGLVYVTQSRNRGISVFRINRT